MAGRERRAFVALTAAFALAFAALTASAQSVSSAEASAIREVIEAQLDAFRRDDSTRAFSYAAPGIRATFGTPENFMAMVREQYAVVYRPHSVNFEEPALIDGELIQPVRLTDAEGRAWIALYPMEKQRDGSWKINGCQLARLAARET